MRATRQRDTPEEVLLRQNLFRMGLRYRVDARIPGVRSRPDIVFPGPKVAVFVDGCFWHGCPVHGTWPKANADWWRNKIEANRQRDAGATAALESAGWLVLRFWSHDDMARAALEVRDAVASRTMAR